MRQPSEAFLSPQQEVQRKLAALTPAQKLRMLDEMRKAALAVQDGMEQFKLWCSFTGVPCVKLDEDPQPRPDFQIEVGGKKILVEIKSLKASKQENEQEARSIKELAENGCSSREHALGKRIAGIVDKKTRKQMKRSESEQLPAMLVFYDGRNLTSASLSDYDLEVAMHGNHVLVLNEQGCIADTKSLEIGPNAKLSPGVGNYMSAWAVLRLAEDEPFRLTVFANKYADRPLPLDEFEALTNTVVSCPKPGSSRRFDDFNPPHKTPKL